MAFVFERGNTQRGLQVWLSSSARELEHAQEKAVEAGIVIADKMELSIKSYHSDHGPQTPVFCLYKYTKRSICTLHPCETVL